MENEGLKKMLLQRLRAARKGKKLTQEQLAKLIGKTNTTVSGWETGYSSPTNSDLTNLSEILEVSVDYLLGKSDSPYIVRDEIDADELFDKRIVKWKGRLLTSDEKKEAKRILEYILSLHPDKDDKK